MRISNELKVNGVRGPGPQKRAQKRTVAVFRTRFEQ